MLSFLLFEPLFLDPVSCSQALRVPAAPGTARSSSQPARSERTGGAALLIACSRCTDAALEGSLHPGRLPELLQRV